MARRRIGQEHLRLGDHQGSRTGSLDDLHRLIDWAAVDRHLAAIYASAKGEPAWPPLAVFKALLLAVWYDLSDVKLAEALADRASFRRFCGFAAEEPTPERTAFVRFRRELLARTLDRVLFAAVTDQLQAQGVGVKTGTLVDATLIPSASLKSDDEARWAGHRRKTPVHGYKAHVATDEAGGLVRSVEVTTANVHDGTMLEAVLPHEPGDVYADNAYAADRFTGVSEPMAECRTWSTHPPGAALRPSRDSRLGTHRFGLSAAASRRSSAPGSARMACAGCAGSGSPRRGCRCASRPSLTTCVARRRS
jgi:transposase, IS5 family